MTIHTVADETVFNVSGMLRKLPNHMSNFGSTDAICIENNTLVMSGYDIDNGLGYINGIMRLYIFPSCAD